MANDKPKADAKADAKTAAPSKKKPRLLLISIVAPRAVCARVVAAPVCTH